MHSAKDLFPDWYNRGVKRDTSPEELQTRRKSVEKLLKNNQGEFWLTPLKIYLGIFDDSNSEYQQVLSVFKEDDDLFAVKNAYLVRLICGCAIAEKIEAGDTYVSDLLSISILISSSFIEEEILPELKEIASISWLKECERLNSLELQENAASIKQTILKITLPAVEGDPYPQTASFKTYYDQVTNTLNALLKDTSTAFKAINTVIENQENIKQNFEILSSETNILWWLFGGYSNVCEMPIKKMTPEVLSVAVALELNELTPNIPGLGKIDNIIFKAFDYIQQSGSETAKLEDILTGSLNARESIQKIFPEIPDKMESICPLLTAFKTLFDFAGSEWKPIYAKKTRINLESSVSFGNFSSQLYKELMLLKIYKACQ